MHQVLKYRVEVRQQLLQGSAPCLQFPGVGCHSICIILVAVTTLTVCLFRRLAIVFQTLEVQPEPSMCVSTMPGADPDHPRRLSAC